MSFALSADEGEITTDGETNSQADTAGKEKKKKKKPKRPPKKPQIPGGGKKGEGDHAVDDVIDLEEEKKKQVRVWCWV